MMLQASKELEELHQKLRIEKNEEERNRIIEQIREEVRKRDETLKNCPFVH